MKRLIYLVIMTALMLSTTSLAMAQSPKVREFAPVQAGYAASGHQQAIFAPDRVIIKFTNEAMQKALLDISPEKGALVPNAQTGLSSLDSILMETSALSIERMQGELKNSTEAKRIGVYNWFIVKVPQGTDIEKVAGQLADDANLEYALPDYVAFPAAVPNDSYYSSNWGHNNTQQLRAWNGYSHSGAYVGTVGFDTNAQTAWDGTQGYGNNSVIIAILDSGVDSNHLDLLQVTGWDYGDSDNNPHDDSPAAGHGTACAGIAAGIANNNLGVTGIAGACSIMPLKVADSTGTMYLSYAANAIYYAANNGAHVASMSFGSNIASYATMDNAISFANNNGVVMLAATGNENASSISYPANNQYVLAVGAASPCGDRKRSSSYSGDVSPGINTDPNGKTCDGEGWWGSNYGTATANASGAVDIIAPTILTTTDITGSAGYAYGDYSTYFNGTSCATPYAAGVVGLIVAANPTWNVTQIKNQLTSTAIDIVNVESVSGWDRYSGYGMVDASAATGASGPVAPVASFTWSGSSGCAPQSVNFTDFSSGTITSYAWNFGDGGTSTSSNPSYSFATAGTFTVSLTVTGPLGSDTMTIVNMITIDTAPVANFSGLPLSGTAPLTVYFSDLSTGNPTSWNWYMSDGGHVTGPNPSYTFVNPGVYSVTLVASNNCGQSSLPKPGYVDVQPAPPPVASFTSDVTSGCGPLTVNFTSTSTGTIDNYHWEFGDGQMSEEQNPSHEFMFGPFTVSLTVSGPSGNDMLIEEEYIFSYDTPFAYFSMSDTTGVAPLAVDFTDLSGMAESWAWNFGGDGSSSETNPSHTFDNAGTYPVQLIVGNTCGTDTTTLNVVVSAPAAPVAGFTANTTGGCMPLLASFTDASSGNITSWNWNFGDGATDTLQSPSHTYTSVGIYDVSLQVTGPGGNDTKTVTGMITITGPPTAMFSVSDTLLTGPFDVTFTDLSTGNPTSWTWDFGDGVTDTLQSPVHTYTADGTYTVTLVATNSCGYHTLVNTNLITVYSSSGFGDVVAARFELGQNYPNPFNPMTTLVFNLAKEGHARLEIYDATGKLLNTLVDENMSAGEHQLTWQPVRLASGIYFARFSANGQTATNRMVLLR